MKKLCVVFALIAFAFGGGALALGHAAGTPAAQVTDPNITANGVVGDVVAVDASAKQIFVKTDMGSVVVVVVADNTIFRRINPSNPSAEKATAITFGELGAGDRVLARGKPSDDRKSLPAKMIFVSTKADLAAKQESDRAEWNRRGIVGVVSALNPQSKEITLQSRGPQGPQPVIVQAGGAGVKFRRYAPDSVKFGEAKPSSFEEVKVGDQLRAKGEKNTQGTVFTPEEVVTGSFRTSVGTITAVNPEKNEVTITQMQGGTGPLTVVVSKDSILKHIPEDMMARMGGMGGPRPGGAGAPSGGPAQSGGERRGAPAAGGPGGNATGTPGPGGVTRRTGGFDIQQMMEMLPPTSMADLKPGRMVVVSSTVGVDPTRVTAIQLLAGIEPIVAMMSGRTGGRPGGAGGGGISGGDLGFGFGIGQP